MVRTRPWATFRMRCIAGHNSLSFINVCHSWVEGNRRATTLSHIYVLFIKIYSIHVNMTKSLGYFLFFSFGDLFVGRTLEPGMRGAPNRRFSTVSDAFWRCCTYDADDVRSIGRKYVTAYAPCHQSPCVCVQPAEYVPKCKQRTIARVKPAESLFINSIWCKARPNMRSQNATSVKQTKPYFRICSWGFMTPLSNYE